TRSVLVSSVGAPPPQFYTRSLHDALPICGPARPGARAAPPDAARAHLAGGRDGHSVRMGLGAGPEVDEQHPHEDVEVLLAEVGDALGRLALASGAATDGGLAVDEGLLAHAHVLHVVLDSFVGRP